MAEVIRMPRMSDTMEEGNIVGWLKEVGDSVEPGDVLAEVETDKATMELESFHEGTLLYIGVKEGPIAVNGILAVIGEKGEDYESLLNAAEDAGTSSNAKDAADEPEKSAEPEKKVEAPAQQTVNETTTASSANHSTDSRIKASPLAKSMAQAAGIDITNVAGSGDHGRIIKRDVEAYINNPAVAEAKVPVKAPVSPSIEYGSHRVSQMRKVIARRLGESKFSSPHFYLTIELDMDQAIADRKAINSADGVKISFNDFVVKAAAMALRKHPMVNASWKGDTIEVHRDINVGVAVAVDEGLLVPVINNTDYKTLSELNSEIRELAGKAKSKKLQPDEMSGNTFTISNLGMFGIEEFTAIINPPDACIMAVGTIKQIPVVKDGEIKIGNVMKVTMSCDHRVVDGAVGAKFLQTFKELMENPIKMIV